jgi:hypothetical protein
LLAGCVALAERRDILLKPYHKVLVGRCVVRAAKVIKY